LIASKATLALNEGGYLLRIRSTWTSSFGIPSVTYHTVQISGSTIVRQNYFDSDAYQAALLTAASILSVMIQELEDAERARGGTRAIVVTAEPDPIEIVVNLCRRFHRVVRQIRRRHDQRSTLEVSDEYDVQDLVHALLTLRFDDIRPEECTPS
jgi:hypothetical protein